MGESFPKAATQACSYTADPHKAAGKTLITEQSHQHKSRGRGLGKHTKAIKYPLKLTKNELKFLSDRKGFIKLFWHSLGIPFMSN